MSWNGNPSLDERRIGVSVDGGIVTLTGEVNSYAERWKAERTVERVKGVEKESPTSCRCILQWTVPIPTSPRPKLAHALRWNVSGSHPTRSR